MEKKAVVWVSVKFLEDGEVEIKSKDGKIEKRNFKKGDLVDLPKELALKLFKLGKILPGIQYTSGGQIEWIPTDV